MHTGWGNLIRLELSAPAAGLKSSTEARNQWGDTFVRPENLAISKSQMMSKGLVFLWELSNFGDLRSLCSGPGFPFGYLRCSGNQLRG